MAESSQGWRLPERIGRMKAGDGRTLPAQEQAGGHRRDGDEENGANQRFSF